MGEMEKREKGHRGGENKSPGLSIGKKKLSIKMQGGEKTPQWGIKEVCIPRISNRRGK